MCGSGNRERGLARRCTLGLCTLLLLGACTAPGHARPPTPATTTQAGGTAAAPTTTATATPIAWHGCRPPSPAAPWAKGTGLIEVHGTATPGVSLWALVFERVPVPVGQQVKIVWRMTGSGAFTVAGRDARGLARLADGPGRHDSSTWDRPGEEWGTVWVFPRPGCWHLRATRGTTSGDLWLRATE
jgi:hypothetical protein